MSALLDFSNLHYLNELVDPEDVAVWPGDADEVVLDETLLEEVDELVDVAIWPIISITLIRYREILTWCCSW